MPKQKKDEKKKAVTHRKHSSGQASPEKVKARKKRRHELKNDYFARRREALGGLNLAKYRRNLLREKVGKGIKFRRLDG